MYNEIKILQYFFIFYLFPTEMKEYYLENSNYWYVIYENSESAIVLFFPDIY